MYGYMGTDHPIITGGNFAIISGEEPKHIPEVTGGHKGLEKELGATGFKFEPTDAGHGSNPRSPAFIVHDVPRDVAMELGRKLGQDSVIYSTNGQHELIYTNGPNAGKFHPAAGHTIFAYAPPGKVSTRVPGHGHIVFHFDTGKLLDVPKKGSAMSKENPTVKNEVNVADLKKALAKSLRNQINKFSKTFSELAKREVEHNMDASVGDLKLGPGTAFEVGDAYEIPEGSPMAKSIHGLATAAAMKRVYDSYLENVASKQFPDDPEKAHTLASAAARDWASNVKDFDSVLEVATGRNVQKAEGRLCKEHGAECKAEMHKDEKEITGETGAKIKLPETMHPKWQERHKRDFEADEAKRAEYKRKGHDVTIKSSDDEWRAELGKADEWLHKLGDEPATKSEMFIDDKNAGKRPATTDEAKKGGPRVKDVGYETEVPAATKPVAGKLDEGSGGEIQKGKMGKAEVPASAGPVGQGTGVGASGIGNLSSAEMLSKPPKSEAQRRAMGAAASGKSNLGIPKSVGKEFIEADPGGKLPARKAELVPDSNSGTSRDVGAALTDKGKDGHGNTLPTEKGKDGEGVGSVLTDKAKSGPGGNKAPTEGTKKTGPGAGELPVEAAKKTGPGGNESPTRKIAKAALVPDSNSGSERCVGDALTDSTKEAGDGAVSNIVSPTGKKLGPGQGGKAVTEKGKKFGTPAEKQTATEKGKDGEGVGSLLTEKGKDGEGVGSVMKAAPPMAKPPSGKNPTPAAPPMSKPKLPKAPKLDKAGFGMAGTRTRVGAGEAQSAAIRSGHEAPPAAPSQPAAPKATPKPPSDYSDFMPPGKFGKSEDFLGNCPLCHKAEHPGNCDAT